MKLFILKFDSSCPDGDGGDAWFGIFSTLVKAEEAKSKLHSARWERPNGTRYGYFASEHEYSIEEWNLDELDVPFTDEHRFVGFIGGPDE